MPVVHIIIGTVIARSCAYYSSCIKCSSIHTIFFTHVAILHAQTVAIVTCDFAVMHAHVST